MYHWIPITNIGDFDQLCNFISEEYGTKSVVERLKEAISPGVRAILVEKEYVDKDYRSTYYNYYAKKGRNYRDDCVRLHFFDGLASFEESTLELQFPDNHPEHHYFGYIVIRPTLVATIGRSVLSPDIRKEARGHTIQSKHKVHVLGRDLYVYGFPSMDQHIDISVCAHVACWSILRHYSERFSKHRELLLHDITLLAHPFDPGGLVPANGLAINEAERVFHAAGAYPLVVTKDDLDPEFFYRQLLSYVESGFPLFVAMDDHAVVVVGHAWKAVPPKTSLVGPRYAWNQVDRLVLVDDNRLPYHCIKVEGPTALGTYSSENFNHFIVPLPEKIFYPADAVEKFVTEFANSVSSEIDMPDDDELIIRYFVTTQASLRRYIHKYRSQFDANFVLAVMQYPTSQFVWVVEYTSANEWGQGRVVTRAILDATASLRDPLPVWFCHDRKSAIFFDRTSPDQSIVLDFAVEGPPLGRMEQNLSPIVNR